MPGPLPDPKRKRRNAPTIPTTELPQSGLAAKGISIPAAPSSLGRVGKAWWKWAWSTPQGAGWGVGCGAESLLERRSSLEDDLAAITQVEALDVADVAGADWAEVKAVVNHLAALATGKLAIMREMRDIDDRLGLTPRGLAALRWTIVADPEPEQSTGQTKQAEKQQEDRRLRIAAG